MINLKKGNFCIDSKTCSVFEESLINFNFKIIEKENPIYILKSSKIKPKKNMIDAHIEDGVALTKFLYWIKKHEDKNLTEKKIEKKLKILEKKIKIIYILALILLLDQDQTNNNSLQVHNIQIEN